MKKGEKKPKRELSGLVHQQDRETVGKIATDLLKKAPEQVSVHELGQDMLSDYMENIWLAVDRGRKELCDSFFVVVLSKRERLLENVIRNQFLYRTSCPTPTYCQSVFKYGYKDDHLEYIWSLPDKESCFMLRDNALIVKPDERKTLGFVLDFFDGTLDKEAQTMNGETIPDPLSIIF